MWVDGLVRFGGDRGQVVGGVRAVVAADVAQIAVDGEHLGAGLPVAVSGVGCGALSTSSGMWAGRPSL